MSSEGSEDALLGAALRGLRERVATIREQNAYPAVERCLQMVDMNLHLALWQLGEAHEPMPELDTQGRAVE
jgi:hypothetical protein